ncbi:peptide chain release factor N(5)-glutamine methyltransferase [Chondrinema litorale]|uniref:peptide chain release factor N(5)-glutamine methyltransferase n=1 Tax=Chondrinema litorale TaxID=2994555 RepID=UPI0025444405|nr:peptide chain release factor N(5)-glutamine methyltransferase [Chondrinema litorale]UZR93312.1 peptide chain release factor N(5)-glutamine methyltransferase [Chondrinema litorale]
MVDLLYMDFEKKEVLRKSAESIFRFIKENLVSVYPEQEARQIAYILLEDAFDITKLDILKNKSLPDFDEEKLVEYLRRLALQEPIQHIVGKTEFLGFEVQVSKDVLIPRPETEELTQKVIDALHAEESNNANILDIGTGSGCIAIAIKKYVSESNVFAMDVSERALEVARNNAKTLKANVEFIQADILKNIEEKLPFFDIIVSNPPYVTQLEKEKMRENVLNFDPHLALFVENENYLLFYKAIINFATSHLKQYGRLFFEINEQFGKEMTLLLKQNNFVEVELLKDFRGKDRFCVGVKN